MSQSSVDKSFADLSHLLNLDELPHGPAESVDECLSEVFVQDSPSEGPEGTESTIDLADLLAQLDAASATLAGVTVQEQETRALAVRDLERYDTLTAHDLQPDPVNQRASELPRRAEHHSAQ